MDHKLLELISKNNDFTEAQLAVMLGKSEEDIQAEIRELEEKGIIKGYRAVIDWNRVPDADVTAIIELKVMPKPETGFDDTAKIVMSYDNVESVYLAASSRYDLIATVKGKTIQEIAEFVSKRLSTLEGVLGTATSFVLTQYKGDGIVFYESNEEEEQRSLIL